MSLRTTRNKKVAITRLPHGYILKLQLRPWLYTRTGVVWLASLAIGKSTRQINDWMMRRKNRRVRRMDSSLTGKEGNRTQAIAIRQVRKWAKEIPVGDSMTLRCESVVPEKQFRIWKKWFKQHEDQSWEVSDEHQSFFFYREE